MSKIETYTNAFVKIFGVTVDVAKSLEYRSIKAWDSIGHMALIAELEANFGIQVETDDIIDFSSFEKGKQILRKYNVEI